MKVGRYFDFYITKSDLENIIAEKLHCDDVDIVRIKTEEDRTIEMSVLVPYDYGSKTDCDYIKPYKQDDLCWGHDRFRLVLR